MIGSSLANNLHQTSHITEYQLQGNKDRNSQVKNKLRIISCCIEAYLSDTQE